MNRSTLFWFVFLLVLISLVGGWFWWPLYWHWNVIGAFMILFGLVGWKLWGGPVKAD